jgi:streptogramin lyase
MRPCWMARALGAGLLLLAASAPAQVPPGDVLVTSIATGQVYRLDPNAPAPMAPVPVLTGGAFVSPRGLAVDRNGLLLVADNGPKTLSRVDPSRNLRAIAALFSAISSALRGVVAASDGRVFVADPGIVPLVEPPLPAIRGITYFPLISQVSVVNGVSISVAVGGCVSRFQGRATCANLFLPTGIAIASEDPELVLLVADGGEPALAQPGRVHQGVIRVFPDRPFAPPIIVDPDNPPYPAVGDETGDVNDELFCAPGPFATPRSLTIDRSPGHAGSVLVTDSGNAALAIPARVFRVAASGCDPAEDPPVEIVAEGNGLLRPIGIAVADDGTIFVADATADTVFWIDPDTGSVNPLSTVGSVDQAWDLQIQRAQPGPYFVADFVTDSTVPALLAVDPALPSRTTVTSAGSLMAPAALEVLPAAAGLVVADPTERAVIEAALTGSQTVASQDGRLSHPTSASRDVDGAYLVTDLGDAGAVPPLAPAVIRIEPTSGDQTLVSEGGKLVRPVAGAIDGSGFLIVADAGDGTPDNPPRIVRISPKEGLGDAGQAVLSPEPSVPPDPPVQLLPLTSPTALALDEGGGVILVADRGDATHPPTVLRLVRLAEPPGRIAFAVGLAASDPLDTPAGIAIDSDRSILVTDGGAAASADDGKVIRVDALSGLQSLVATDGTLDEPTGIGVRAPPAGAFVDQDEDLITDAEDNCVAFPNTDQRDTDLDRIGNACDPDYNNDAVVGNSDFIAMRRAFGSMEGNPGYDEDIDADGDGQIGNVEFGLMRSCFGTTPGVSALLGFSPDLAYCKPLPPAP